MSCDSAQSRDECNLLNYQLQVHTRWWLLDCSCMLDHEYKAVAVWRSSVLLHRCMQDCIYNCLNSSLDNVSCKTCKTETHRQNRPAGETVYTATTYRQPAGHKTEHCTSLKSDTLSFSLGRDTSDFDLYTQQLVVSMVIDVQVTTQDRLS